MLSSTLSLAWARTALLSSSVRLPTAAAAATATSTLNSKKALWLSTSSSSSDSSGSGFSSGNNNYYARPAGAEVWHGKDKSGYKFPQHNLIVHPPIEEQIPRGMTPSEYRPAYVCHMRSNCKYSYKRMWYLASMVRGLSVEEAIKQLSFINTYGAIIAKEVILEAQEMAVEEHNVEFKSNMWISESSVGKGHTLKGMRRHARGTICMINYGYIHYFVTLEEGKPPKDYYEWKRTKKPQELLEQYVRERRSEIVPYE